MLAELIASQYRVLPANSGDKHQDELCALHQETTMLPLCLRRELFEQHSLWRILLTRR